MYEWFERQKLRSPSIGFFPSLGNWYAEIVVVGKLAWRHRVIGNGKTLAEAIADLRSKLTPEEDLA